MSSDDGSLEQGPVRPATRRSTKHEPARRTRAVRSPIEPAPKEPWAALVDRTVRREAGSLRSERDRFAATPHMDDGARSDRRPAAALAPADGMGCDVAPDKGGGR